MILTDMTAFLLAACPRCQSPIPPHPEGPGVIPALAVSGSLLFVPAPANFVGGETVLQLRAHFSLLVRHQSAAYLYRFAAAYLDEWPLSVLKSYFCAPHSSFFSLSGLRGLLFSRTGCRVQGQRHHRPGELHFSFDMSACR